MTTAQLIIHELHAAIAEQGEKRTLRLLQGRNTTDGRTKFIIDTACPLFGITRQELHNSKQGTDARRVVASVMRRCGYADSQIQAAINKSKSTVYEYLRFMRGIEEKPHMARLFADILDKKNTITEKLYEYGKQRA